MVTSKGRYSSKKISKNPEILWQFLILLTNENLLAILSSLMSSDEVGAGVISMITFGITLHCISVPSLGFGEAGLTPLDQEGSIYGTRLPCKIL